jgi:hypothetical protein
MGADAGRRVDVVHEAGGIGPNDRLVDLNDATI